MFFAAPQKDIASYREIGINCIWKTDLLDVSAFLKWKALKTQ